MASGNVGDGDVFGHLTEGAIAPKKRLGVLQPFSRERSPQRRGIDRVQSRIISTPPQQFDFLIKILSCVLKKRCLIGETLP